MIGRLRVRRACAVIAGVGAATVGAFIALPAVPSQAGATAPLQVMDIVNVNTPQENYVEAEAAATAAVKAINSSGGINGQKIILTLCNDMANPDQAASCAQQAVSNHDVAVVNANEAYGVDVLPVLSAAHIPFIGAAGDTPSDYTDPDSYPYEATLGDEFYNFAAVAKKFGHVTSLAMVGANLAPSIAIGKYVITGASADHVPFVKSVLFPLTVTDFTPYIEAMKSAGANGVAALIAQGFQTAFFQAEQTLNYLVPTISYSSLISPTILAALGPALTAKLYIISAMPPATATKQYPVLKTIAQNMLATGMAGDTDVDQQALDTYLGYYAIKAAVKSTKGPITAPKLQSALNHAKDLNLLGIVTKWTPSAKGPSNEPRATKHKLYVETVQNGVEVQVGTIGS
jgi:ABC-type branched-subunit amino acid transport system substrate-binding protein